MWEFYLVACELSFRVQGMVVFQIQMAKRVDSVPLRRDYMVDWERAHAPPVHATPVPALGETRAPAV
jgi:cyclopropane-fatty-acyl-phospholipid synthase